MRHSEFAEQCLHIQTCSSVVGNTSSYYSFQKIHVTIFCHWFLISNASNQHGFEWRGHPPEQVIGKQPVAILAQVLSAAMVAVSSSRPCNVGPTPPVNETSLQANLKVLIENTSRDTDIFEWASLANVSKGGACPYSALAEKADMVIAHLQAAPSARITESVLKRVYGTVISPMPTRAIFPSTPRPELLKVLCRIVRDWETLR